MKTKRTLILGFLLSHQLHAEGIVNPAIQYSGFVALAENLGPFREKNRLSEGDFLKMAGEARTVILHARSKDKFDAIHIKGALHLAFTDFTEESLKIVIPDQTTRILIHTAAHEDL